MLLGLLLCGILVGALAAVASLVAGFPLWAAFGFYALGGVVGICASGLLLWAHRRHRVVKPMGVPRHRPAAAPKGASPRG
jgi:hypothetical protein